jgi:hypothetical protein
MLQNGLDLFTCHTGEPLEKVVDPRAIFEVRKEGLDRNPGAAEDPGTADLSRISLDRRTLVPIKHR